MQRSNEVLLHDECRRSHTKLRCCSQLHAPFACRVRQRIYEAMPSSPASYRRDCGNSASNNEKVAARDRRQEMLAHAAPSAATRWCRARHQGGQLTPTAAAALQLSAAHGSAHGKWL